MNILFLLNLNTIIEYCFLIIYTLCNLEILKTLYNYIIFLNIYIYIYIIKFFIIFEIYFKKYFYIEFINYLLYIYNNNIFIIIILISISYLVVIYIILKKIIKKFLRIWLYKSFILYFNCWFCKKIIFKFYIIINNINLLSVNILVNFVL